jgi:hypothetical protein
MRLVELKQQKINALCRDIAERLVLTEEELFLGSAIKLLMLSILGTEGERFYGR